MIRELLQERQRLTINRLIRLIRQMPEEEQVSVLKQLLEGDLTSHVIDIVNKMPYEQQLALLQQIGEMPEGERPVKTLLLDEEESFMRGYQRKSCLIEAEYLVEGKSYKGYILDISVPGLFLETRIGFPVGQALEISFSMPDTGRILKVNAVIAWRGRFGVGIKFTDLKRDEEDLIRSFVEMRQ